MLLFCDESGDPGLPMEPGASAYFALGILCFRNGAEAARLAAVQEGLRSGLGWRGGRIRGQAVTLRTLILKA